MMRMIEYIRKAKQRTFHSFILSNNEQTNERDYEPTTSVLFDHILPLALRFNSIIIIELSCRR